jgi:hypothetical protein
MIELLPDEKRNSRAGGSRAKEDESPSGKNRN